MRLEITLENLQDVDNRLEEIRLYVIKGVDCSNERKARLLAAINRAQEGVCKGKEIAANG